jgi:hypothetical protein
MIDEDNPEVREQMKKALQLQQLTREWSDRYDAAVKDTNTTEEELRLLRKVGIDLVDCGLEIAVLFMDDEDFPINVREMVLKMMADIPIFRERNSIV